MKRTERHQLKQDEFVHWLDEAFAWARDNQKNIVNAVLVVAGAGLLLGGLGIYRNRQSEAARSLFAVAMEQYNGVVESGTGAAPAPGTPTFASEEERYQTALEHFERVASEYGSYEPGRQARYYVGICRAALGDFDAAATAFESVREGGRDLLYYLATRSLAAANAERGEMASASDIYRSLIEDQDNPLPKDHLLYSLARLEERAGNAAQAKQYYDRMLEEYPSSSLRGDALTRSGLLEYESGGPESSD